MHRFSKDLSGFSCYQSIANTLRLIVKGSSIIHEVMKIMGLFSPSVGVAKISNAA